MYKFKNNYLHIGDQKQ